MKTLLYITIGLAIGVGFTLWITAAANNDIMKYNQLLQEEHRDCQQLLSKFITKESRLNLEYEDAQSY